MNTELYEKYGEFIDLGYCVAGKNLNTWTIRGYQSLKVLAEISGGDEYDEHLNPTGTQRDLGVKHSREALDYALQAQFMDVEDNPRAFPEITLNVRQQDLIQILDSMGNEVDISSFSDLEEAATFRLRIRTAALIYPVEKYGPQISRVDGNHRLSQANALQVDEEELIPSVPFAMFIGLSTSQERKLFTDINGKHVGMPPAITTNFTLEGLADDLAVVEMPAAWLAKQLSREGMVFYGKVHLGGSAVGAKEKFGAKGPITIQGLKSAIAATLDASPTLRAQFFPTVDLHDPINNTEAKRRERVERAQAMVKLLNRYWTAVRDSNPEAWEDKKEFILLSTIGLNAYAYLAGPVIQRLLQSNSHEYKHFKSVTDHLADRMPLAREEYLGVAGAGGVKRVRDALLTIWAQSDVGTTIAVSDLLSEGKNPLD